MAGIGVAIGEIGFKALASRAGGSALKWLGSLDLVHLLLLGVSIFASWQFVEIHGLEFRLIPVIGPRIHIVSLNGQIVDAKAETAKVRADLATSRANEAALKKAIADQNAAIADLGSQSVKQQKIASRASQEAAQRARDAEATAERLRRSSRSGAGKSAPAACEPSDVLKGQWK